MELHKLLIRQLNKLKLSENVFPSNPEQWQSFLARVNSTYVEVDQERYLLERSLEISSRELYELNSKLEEAQHIAKLSYWFYDRTINKMVFSKEMYSLFGSKLKEFTPSIDLILNLVHEDDKSKINEMLNLAFSESTICEIEIRIKSNDEVYKWYYIMGHSNIVQENSIYQLSVIMMDIDKRKRTEEELHALHQQLITSARRAGMADVATSILHNVGNILNSANVSISLVQENIKEPYFEKLFSIQKMLDQHSADLTSFLLADPKGKLIPEYLNGLIKKINNIYNITNNEIENLKTQITHIKDITTMQKNLSGVSEMSEKIFLPAIIDDAIKMCGQAFENKDINIIKSIKYKNYITTDKSRLLQILINLIQNANDSLVESKIENKELIISIEKNPDDSNSIIIAIQDNGMGIDEKYLMKIFSFGFTTKVLGHGFGLHSSALVAKELNGTLQVRSDGAGLGASFILTLPISLIN